MTSNGVGDAEVLSSPPPHRLVPGSETAAIKFSPHYLRQPHHRLVLGGNGQGEKGKRKDGGGDLKVESGGGHTESGGCEE